MFLHPSQGRHSTLGPLCDDRPEQLGTFEFPDERGEICDVVGYCAQRWRDCGQRGVPRRPHSWRLSRATDSQRVKLIGRKLIWRSFYSSAHGHSRS